MAQDFGNGVSRTLDPFARQFQAVVFQEGKPPLDSELNLVQQDQVEQLAQLVRAEAHSGFFLDPTRALSDFVTDPSWSNLFEFAQQKLDEDGDPEELAPVMYANVNGWVIPVAGTNLVQENRTTNEIRLYPPPESDARIDFIFLEAWQVSVAPNPSTANKPAADKIWKWGNVEFGATNLDDDITDPTIGFETTERIQLQYRIRVVGSGSGAGSSPDLSVYPDGLGDPNVFAQGPQSAVTAFTFDNMRDALGDPSLWRAGDGDPQNSLGTTDGYTYALPMCAVFRRNNQPYVAVNLSGNPNQNGAFDRNPSAATLAFPPDGAQRLTTMALVNDMLPEQFAVDTLIEVDNLLGSGWDDPNLDLTKAFMVIEGEVIGISAVDTTSSPNTVTVPAGGRGRWGTDPVFHEGRNSNGDVGSGSAVAFFNTRDDGLFADEIAENDILDLRRGCNLGDWDYSRILLHNVSALMRNRLRSTWKQAGNDGGDTQGVTITEVDYLLQDGGTAVPFGTEALDGPDGIRQIWSDAAAIQGDVTVMLNPDGTINAGFIQTGDDLVDWDVGADFKPAMFMNNVNNASPGPGFTDGTTVFLYIGGDDGTNGARKTFRDGGTRAVRFVSPVEYWKTQFPNSNTGLQNPVTMLWVNSTEFNNGSAAAGAGLQALTPAGPGQTATEFPGPMYPLQSQDFEKPFLVCGGVLNSASVITGVDGATQLEGNSLSGGSIPLGEGEIVLPGIDFDTAGDWWSATSLGAFANDASLLNFPVIRGQRTLWDLLTNGGTDITGKSSEVYLIIFGDDETTANNGAFRVIGAGTTAANGGLTTNPASQSNRLRVEFISQGIDDFDNTTTKTVTVEMRSQITNAEDGNGSAGGPAAMTITCTDLRAVAGGASNPWNEANINPGAKVGHSLMTPFDYKTVINLTLMYHPGRGAMARVPDKINRITIQSALSTIMRQSDAVLDPNFPNETGAPGNPAEVDYCPTHIQTWNRLPSLGLPAPQAPDYGGNVVLSSEIDRENESFFDNGSKTLLFRPIQQQAMTFQGFTIITDLTDPTSLPPANTNTLLGAATTVNPLNGTQYPNPSLILNGWDGPKDDAQIFTTGLRMAYPVPSQYVPRFGRQDIPYFQDNGPIYGAGVFLDGINHLFSDTTDLTNPVFDIIGGEDNQTGGVQVTPMYLQTGSTGGLEYGQYATILGTLTPGYQGRLTTEVGDSCSEAAEITAKLNSVVSSDFGAGLKGIMLPPYLGIARLAGVYDRRDFVAKGGVTFQSDRVTPEANPAINLLRRDADKQTLFICEDGAFDLTGVRGDHTYIVPFNAIDITKSPDFVADELPEQLEYVLEFTAYGFGNGWINENNFVMARRHNGQGTLRQDIDNPELSGAFMNIPSAAPDSSRLYTAYNRTVYQGDPYMTRQGETRTTTDYENRYGQVSQGDAFGMNNSIQQYDAEGDQVPERPNARSFQVLAAVDFYTTMGTGNVGGRLFPGTVTDVGYTNDALPAADRIPADSDTPAWRILTRSFTEGQANVNTDRAQAVLEITGSSATVPVFDYTVSALTIFTPAGLPVVFTGVNGATAADDEFDASSPDVAVVARELWTKINARTEIQSIVVAFNDIDSPQIELVAFEVGAAGNEVKVQINNTDDFLLKVPTTGAQGLNALLTTTNLLGGDDLRLNAGSGTTQLDLTGMTERMPLGILLQDSDFIGENPLNDTASAVNTFFGGIRPVQSLLPLTASAGEEFTRFAGSPGELVASADGAILQYTAFDENTNPGGSKRFRLFRGGGSSLVLGGRNPGGPVDWFSDTMEPALMPVLKGGLLACKALLVRNFVEEAFSTDDTTTDGDEIQMVLLTLGIIGEERPMQQQSGITIGGIISPTGFGEGYAASDRYRINGKPMFVGRTRVVPDPETVPMAPFPGRDESEVL
jgi:hypothetical protein